MGDRASSELNSCARRMASGVTKAKSIWASRTHNINTSQEPRPHHLPPFIISIPVRSSCTPSSSSSYSSTISLCPLPLSTVFVLGGEVLSSSSSPHPQSYVESTCAQSNMGLCSRLLTSLCSAHSHCDAARRDEVCRREVRILHTEAHKEVERTTKCAPEEGTSSIIAGTPLHTLHKGITATLDGNMNSAPLSHLVLVSMGGISTCRWRQRVRGRTP